MRVKFKYIHILSAASCTVQRATAGSDLPSKRGIAFLGAAHDGDNQLLLTANTSISWYYTWSLNPSWKYQTLNNSVVFLPLIHGLDDATDSRLESRLGSLPASSTHLLTFNEPDGTTDSGGSAISPRDAATAYLSSIAPLRTATDSRSRAWKVSHPSVTGSGRGLDWLRAFIGACAELNPGTGCPTDFVAVHWYGDFAGLAGWLGTLREFYNATGNADPRFWVTEMALPQGSKEGTFAMMNSSLPYLDALQYLDGYAWFGAFRSNDANEWTGNAVSLFDDRGGLTELGALYLGGQQRGYEVGMMGLSGRHLVMPWVMCIMLVVSLAWVV
jgi:hypothetical protein